MGEYDSLYQEMRDAIIAIKAKVDAALVGHPSGDLDHLRGIKVIVDPVFDHLDDYEN